MSRKFYLSFLAIALAITATVAFVIGHNSGTRAASANSALSALPASDFVINVDVQRALNETLPSLLSNNPAMLAKFNSHLEEFQQKTGINPRVFESVAVGGKLNQAAARRDDSTVVIARGSFNSTDLINAGFAAAQKECQFEKEEQQYEGRTIYLISSVRRLKKDADKDAAPAIQSQAEGGSGFGPRTDSNLSSFEVLEGRPSAKLSASPPGHEKFAITAIDANTIAVGSLESVRAAIDASLGRNRVDDELVRLASQSPNAVVSFSGRIPQGVAEKPVPNNPFGNYFASIREFYGSFSASGNEAETFIALRTEKAEQANDISQALNSMKSLVGLGFAQSTGDAAQANSLADLLKGVSITTEGNEVQISAKFQPGSLAPFVRHF